MIIVPALHPAALLRGMGDDTSGLAKFEDATLDDLRKALRLTKSRPVWDERAIWERDSVGRLKNLFPTAEEVIEFCRAAKGQLLAVDTETTGESPLTCRLICVGMASANGRVLCVPFLSKGGVPYWSQHDLWRVRSALGTLLADSETPKVAHNYIFDTIVLWAHGLPIGGECHCSMQMLHCIDSELPMGLGYAGTRYLDVRYWKDDVKGDEGWLGLDDITMRSYNLRDCLVCLRLVPGFMQRLKGLGLVDLYREELQVAGIMGRATVRGLQIDFTKRDEPNATIPEEYMEGGVKKIRYVKGLGPRLVDQMNDALSRLRALSGDPTFDPLKPQALRALMFGRLGLPIVKMSKSGLQPSTDKEAMVLLALAADTPEQKLGIKALADFKSGHKLHATFVRGLPALGDGRLHVSWKLLTATGRLMSSPNAQNWGKKIKKIFGYDSRSGPSGKKLVGVDLKQAELRGIAYLSRSKRLLDMYAQDLNVHTVNAMLSLRVRPQQVPHKDLDPQTEAYVLAEAAKMNLDPSQFQAMPQAAWAATRTLIKRDFFGRNYGADDDTVFRIERSDRDPETNELLFPLIELRDVQANGIVYRRLNTDIVRWWDEVQNEVKLKGHHKCPVSGRIRWFREGFKRTHILGHPNQTLIASIVNKRMIEIQREYDRETGGQALIVQQVHDAVNAEVPDGYEKRAGQIMVDAFEQRVELPGFSDAYFPADKPTIGDHLDQI